MSKSKSFGLAELDTEERKDVVATLFVLILQIFGRLARVTDVTKPEPHVYFIDGAFRGREEKQGDFDCLSELGRYLDALMTCKDSAELPKRYMLHFIKLIERTFRMNHKMYPLAYKLSPKQTCTLYYLGFPTSWKRPAKHRTEDEPEV